MTLAFDMVVTPRPGLKGPNGQSSPLPVVAAPSEQGGRGANPEATTPLPERDSTFEIGDVDPSWPRSVTRAAGKVWNPKSHMGEQSSICAESHPILRL